MSIVADDYISGVCCICAYREICRDCPADYRYDLPSNLAGINGMTWICGDAGDQCWRP
jgi:hypothetical protein